MKTVAVRVDASVAIGSGHLMRCLTLAEALQERGARVHFICRHLPAVLGALVAARGFTHSALPAVEGSGAVEGSADPAHASWLIVDQETDARQSLVALESLGDVDLLIVDHYAIEARWERTMHARAKQMLVIDDLADRMHACDFLLDPNYYADLETRYRPLVQDTTRCLLGPSYALLRAQFSRAREEFPRAQRAYDPVRRVNICYGGVDAAGATLTALAALEPWLVTQRLAVDVVLGEASPRRDAVRAVARRHPTVSLHIAPVNVAELLAVADVGYGASGSMTWERACVGLPSIASALALNQQRVGLDAGNAGLHLFVQNGAPISARRLQTAFRSLEGNPGLRKSLADAGQKLVDGHGAARAVRILESST